MTIKLDFRGDDFGAAIGQLSKTWRDAAATALNRTAEENLAQTRKKMQAGFILRVPGFDLPPQQLPSSWRAKPDKLWVQVGLGNDEGPKSIGARRVQIFSKFGTDQVKTNRDTRNPIAIPTTNLRPNVQALVPRGMYPKSLRLGHVLMPNPKGGGLAWLEPKAAGTRRRHTVTVGSGKQKLRLRQQDRTFIMPNQFGKKGYGVWERIGSGARDVQMIWMFREQVHIPKRMSFEEDTQKLVNERLRVNFDGAFALSLAGTLWGRARR